MEWPAARLVLVLVTLLTPWSSAIAVASPPVVASVAPVRVGVVLDLTSHVGRERRACISTALDDFDAAHPSSYGARVELLVRDSRGDLAMAAHAADDLLKNGQVQAIIWGPEELTKADRAAHLRRHRNHIPVISFSSIISPASCAFWLEDLTAPGSYAKFGFTHGSDNITFPNPETGRTYRRKLDTRNSRKSCRSKAGLNIAVPLKLGFQVFVNVTDPYSEKQNVTGYSIDIFEAAMMNLHPLPCYEYLVFNGTYDELVGNVSLGVYDGAVGDVTITAERVTTTDFTMPYTQSGVSMLVLAEDEPDTIRWTFVKPLTRKLWLATVVFFFYTGFVVWMIELPRNQEYQGSSLRQCSTALYFVFSTLTFSHGHTIKSPLSKIVVVIWCFVVLILVQSYTASLSSILTAKRLRPWMTDFDQLRHSGDFVGYQDDSFVRSFLMNHNISESRLRNYTTKEEYADALWKGSNNGGVSAIVDEIPYLTSFLSDRRYGNDFRMLGCIYKTPGFGFAFNLGSPLVHNLSTAILNLAGGDEGSRIEVKWFGTNSSPIRAGTIPDTDSAPLTLESFSGLFVITGSISTLMLLISIMRFIYAKCIELRRADVESVSYTGTDDESRLLQNGIGGNPSPDQQPLHEAGNNHSGGVHMSGENAGDTEPNPVQQNGMHGGSVPAGHTQIEMCDV
ncbi:glutamate receptor 2.9-like [Triticum dicoccoides]|uniref:glutamate receptor 2.9-like n=1 Tax=Triticum dicoccoides TaxID=85692 RepID=UPI0018915190|nr:glutamate receptor 2.9-like [Triticum dicoccoides]